MTTTTYLLFGITSLLALLGVAEYALHRMRLRNVPVRVHVNGTRGKSSVTRLIAAGLRAGGVRCLAKTTGTVPRFILPNGREFPIDRPAGPNIIEQRRAVQVADAQRADVLVVECMALQPQLQWLSESRLVQATHGVITNARPDHLDVMGPSERDVALALAGMIPRRGVLFTTERKHHDVFEYVSKARATKLHTVEPEVAAISEEELGRFRYRAHRDNVALALATCEALGIERETALNGMWNAKPDPGATTEHHMRFYGRALLFVNGFAANDPVSTKQIWHEALERHTDFTQSIAVFNCRADRPDRSKQLAEAYVDWTQADDVVLIGAGQYIFARAAVRRGLDPTRITFVDEGRPSDIFEAIIALIHDAALVMGMGNIAEPGLGLSEYFANRGKQDA